MNEIADIFEQKYYGNTTTLWLIAAGIFVLSVAVVATLKPFLVNRFQARAKLTKTEVDDVLVDLLRRTRPYFYTLILLQASAQILTLPNPVFRGLDLLALTATLFQIMVWGTGVIDYVVKRYIHRNSAQDGASVGTIRAVGVVTRFLLMVIVVLIALKNLGFDITALVAGLGIGGVAVALAVQNILGDLFGALSIMVDKPFVIGDTIAVDDFVGSVENIGLKTTRIRSQTGEQLVFANSDLLKSRIRNYRRMYQRRVAFTVRLPYETDRKHLSKVPAMIRRIIEAQQDVRFERSHFLTFADSSLNIETVYHVLTADYTRYADIQQSINLTLLQELDTAGIELAFPKPSVIVQHIPAELLGTNQQAPQNAEPEPAQ